MKNKFDIKLFKHTLRQLFLPAVIMGAACIVSTIINLLQTSSDNYYNYYSFLRIGMSRFFEGEPTAAGMAPALIVFMYIGAAVFTFLSFKHQNSRKESDFYDTLPNTKLSGYISRISAILSLQYALIIITMLVSVITMIINGITFDFSFVPKLTLSYIAGSTLIVGAISLAMSLTGTLPANIMMTFVILGVPRFMLFLAGRLIIGVASFLFIDLSKLGIFLNPVYNIPFASILDFTVKWEYYGLSETLIHVGAIIYTLILGIIYLAIAMYFSNKRSSELAEHGVKNKAFANVLSALVALPFLSYAFYSIIRHGVINMVITSNKQQLIVFLAIGIIIFIIAQYILKREVKGAIKSLPILLVTIAISLGFIYLQNSYGVKMTATMPDVEEVEYIKINEHYEAPYRYKFLYTYRGLLTKDIEYTDKELIELVWENTKRTSEDIKKLSDGSINYIEGRNEFYCEFKLKNGKSFYRLVKIHQDDYSDINRLITTNPEYEKLVYSLPSDEDISKITLQSYNQYFSDGFSNKLYKKYKKEFEYLNLDEQNIIIFNNGYHNFVPESAYPVLNNYYHYNITSSFRVCGYKNGERFCSYYPISNYTPNTLEMYIEEYNKHYSQNLLKLINVLKNLKDSKEDYVFSCKVMNRNIETPTTISEIELMYYTQYEQDGSVTKENFNRILNMADSKKFESICVDDPILFFSIRHRSESFENNRTGYMQITQEEFEIIKQMYVDFLS